MGALPKPWDTIRQVQHDAEEVRKAEIDAANRRLGPLGKWQIVGEPGTSAWTDPAWGTRSGYEDPAFTIDTAGWVQFRGVAEGPSAALTTNLWVVDDLYRPPARTPFGTPAYGAEGQANDYVHVEVTSSGIVRVVSNYFSLPGVIGKRFWFPLSMVRYRIL